MKLLRRFAGPLGLLLALTLAPPVAAWEMSGSKNILLHPREGRAIVLGTVDFQPQGERVAFTLHLDHGRFKDFFLSMKEFKCLEATEEIQCHVPYPYANPAAVTTTDLRWLEHALLFLHKSPREFGAKLWNGLYYRLQLTDGGLVGTPQAVDLGLIGAPPADLSVPPFGPGERSDIAPDSRWFNRLSIE